MIPYYRESETAAELYSSDNIANASWFSRFLALADRVSRRGVGAWKVFGLHGEKGLARTRQLHDLSPDSSRMRDDLDMTEDTLYPR